MRVAAFEGAPGESAAPVPSAPLGLELNLVGPGIAGHDLDFGAEHVAVEQRENVGIGARALAPKSCRFGQQFAEALYRRVMARDTEAHLIGDAAEPGELRAVELGFVEQRRNPLTTREGADNGAVLRGHGIKVIRRLEAA